MDWYKLPGIGDEVQRSFGWVPFSQVNQIPSSLLRRPVEMNHNHFSLTTLMMEESLVQKKPLRKSLKH
jgi:hypothetical protein